MKTIMIQDTVYKKLSALKKSKSFSKILDELVEESKNAKIARIKKYFGITKKNDAKVMKSRAAKVRSEFEVRYS